MRAKTQKPIFFKNTCNCIVDYIELEKAILWMQEFNTHSKKKIYLFGKYPGVTIGNKKIHVHRLLLMYWEGRILDRKEYSHHIDGNKLNSSRDNLEIMDCSVHQSIHNKGKAISEEHKEAIRVYNRKRKGIKYNKNK